MRKEKGIDHFLLFCNMKKVSQYGKYFCEKEGVLNTYVVIYI